MRERSLFLTSAAGNERKAADSRSLWDRKRMVKVNLGRESNKEKKSTHTKWELKVKANKEENMGNISELELQNLRHLIGGYDTSVAKMEEYANCATDPKIKQFFQKGAKTAQENKQTLMKFLQ